MPQMGTDLLAIFCRILKHNMDLNSYFSPLSEFRGLKKIVQV